jgi:Spy/CpxP family protein refolding chaperone
MRRAFTTAGLSIFLSGMMFAQAPSGPPATGGTAPDPATRIADQVSRLTTLLDLTPAQATQETSILTAAQSATSSLQTTLDTDRTSLQTAIQSNTTATIEQLSAAIGTISGQILAIRSKADAAFYALLTAAQQAKLATIGGPGGLGGGRGGPGAPGGGRGPRP